MRLAGELAHGLVAGPSGLDVLSFSARAGAGPTGGSGRIVTLGEVEPVRWDKDEYGCVDRDLGRAAGSVRAGLVHLVVDPGKLNCPPHCHSAEEELFVVLDGEGVCLLGDEEHPMRQGSVVGRPPGTGVAHAFRGPLTLLAYGTRDTNDVCYYPRTKKIHWRGSAWPRRSTTSSPGGSLGGFDETDLCRRAALLAPRPRPQSPQC